MRATKSLSQLSFKQHADLAAGMNVGADRALIRGAGSLLLRRRHAALAQHDECIFDIALGLLQSLQAVAHGRARLLAKLLHQLCINLLSSLSSSPLLLLFRYFLDSNLSIGFRPISVALCFDHASTERVGRTDA